MKTDGDESEAEGDRRDDGESGERRAAERAERVDDVARQVVDDRGAARVAALVGGKRHRAETRERPRASVDGAQAGGDVLLRLALDMERELLVELAFDAARSHQRANPQEHVAELHLVTPASSRGRWPWTCVPTRRLPPPVGGDRMASAGSTSPDGPAPRRPTRLRSSPGARGDGAPGRASPD